MSRKGIRMGRPQVGLVASKVSAIEESALLLLQKYFPLSNVFHRQILEYWRNKYKSLLLTCDFYLLEVWQQMRNQGNLKQVHKNTGKVRQSLADGSSLGEESTFTYACIYTIAFSVNLILYFINMASYQ